MGMSAENAEVKAKKRLAKSDKAFNFIKRFLVNEYYWLTYHEDMGKRPIASMAAMLYFVTSS
jgi:hypothetical protein